MDPIKAIETLAKRDWTQGEIADAVGCSQPTIGRILKGQAPRFDLGTKLVALAQQPKKRVA